MVRNSVVHSFVESCKPLRHDKAMIHEGEKVEVMTDFIFLGSKITAGGDFIREIKRHLLAPWKKSYDKPRQYVEPQLKN